MMGETDPYTQGYNDARADMRKRLAELAETKRQLVLAEEHAERVNDENAKLRRRIAYPAREAVA